MTLGTTPQVPPGSPPQTLEYTQNGDVLTVTHRTYRLSEPDPETGQQTPVLDAETTDMFDFTGTQNGELDVASIITALPVQPIVSGERVSGELALTVLDWSVE